MQRGFIRERDSEQVTYLGHKLTVESDRVTVHGPAGTKAVFGSMPAARAFVRMLGRRQR